MQLLCRQQRGPAALSSSTACRQGQSLHRCQQSRKPSRRLHAEAPDKASSSSSSSSSGGSGGTNVQQPAPETSHAAAGGIRNAVSHAQQELQASWQQLKDAAGVTFVPDYSSSSSSAAAAKKQQQRQRIIGSRSYSSVLHQLHPGEDSNDKKDQVVSIPGRLKRLLTLQFLRPEAAAAGKGGDQPFNTQLAAMNFELQQALQGKTRKAQQQWDEQQQQQREEELKHGQRPASAAASDSVIDVTSSIQQAGPSSGPIPTAAAAAAATTSQEQLPAAAQTSSTAATAAEVDEDAAEAQATEFFPATAQLLVLATWAVFAFQWWPALPELWKAVRLGAAGKALFALLFMFPDSSVTRLLCLDLSAMQAGTSFSGILTAGLLHSGLLITLVNTAALFDAGRWLEAGGGSLQLLATFLLASVTASIAHLLAGSSMLCVAGSGAVVGVYVAWVAQARMHFIEDSDLRELYIATAVLLGLNFALGLLQPGVGLASIAGGMLGGLLAVKVAGPVADALYWGLAGPILAVLLVSRVALDGLKLALTAVALVVSLTVQGFMSLLQAVRRI